MKEIVSSVRNLIKLYIENGRLSLTDILTQLLSGFIIALVCILFAIMALGFISYGVIGALSASMPIVWAYTIVAGFYILLIAILIIFKRTLLINPIARFLSKIIMKPTHNYQYQDENE